jgi:hypothetical protein
VIDVAAQYFAIAIHLPQFAFGIVAILSEDHDTAQFLSFSRFQRKIIFQHGTPQWRVALQMTNVNAAEYHASIAEM